MPHAGIHLTLARQTIGSWQRRNSAPFDIDNDRAVNAFMFGSIGPDMGHFPGGDHDLAHAIHTRNTGDMQRALLALARSEEQRAFSWGWLTHVLADVLIHPLVNEDAARRLRDGVPRVVEHIRVEAGLDVWFCARNPQREDLRLRRVFDRSGYDFLVASLDAVLGISVHARRLVQMERNSRICAHGALHFVRAIAQQTAASLVARHAAARLSPRNSLVRAYFAPHVPESRLVHRVEEAFHAFDRMLNDVMTQGVDGLPNYNLELGGVAGHEADLLVA